MNNTHIRKNKGICRVCGAIRIKGFNPEFIASGCICVDCYYKTVEPNNPIFGINKRI